MIAIVNYNMGNLQSVANMLGFLQAPCEITSDPLVIKQSEKIILPGVGAFGEAMKNLRGLGLVEVLHEEIIDKKKPFLGICLGMQMVADKSFEGGEFEGLGFIHGVVQRLAPEGNLRVPHVGWNDVTAKPGTVLYGEELKTRVFYFVHSYHFVPADDADASGYTDYGGKVVASIERGNIMATQFHPEKSQRDGIALLKNFLAFK